MLASITDKLINLGLISDYPKFIKNNIHWEVMMGSIAYGCNNDLSDIDIYGFTIPDKCIIFPHINGYINGFGKKPDIFRVFQKHHILKGNTNYDLNIYNIVTYFQLCMENNPNMIDSLFVPDRCILYSTEIGNYLRSNRHIFLHKGCYFKLKGYAYSQLSKLENKVVNKFIKFCDFHKFSYDITETFLIDNINKTTFKDGILEGIKIIKELDKSGIRTKRLNSIVQYGYDVKFAYHTLRLVNQCEQILREGDLNLELNKDQLIDIRKGKWKIEDIIKYFKEKEKELDSLYISSKLQESPNEDKIKEILLHCLKLDNKL